jgi:3-hydroxyisobutyrate dehydrogenase
MTIACIGLGNMGAPMARCLIAAGHSVIGFDPQTRSDGIPCAPTAALAVQDVDVVISMLPNGDILRAVCDDIYEHMSQGALHLDCSTVDVQSAKDTAQATKIEGLMAVDAPVSGGIGGATNGTLTFMAGGKADAFAKAAPLFDIMGQRAVHCGASGSGQAAKICNNMILGATMIATCEAFALADRLGLDRQSMFDVVSTSSGQSWSINTYCPAPDIGPNSPADNAYTPGFSASLMLKDLRLSQQAAKATGAVTPMGERAMEIYADFVELYGMGGMDFSAMLPHLEGQSR